MKIFTVEDYLKISDEAREKVNAWLKKYGMSESNVNLITSQSSLTEDESDGFVYEDDHLAVYADITVKRYISPDEFIPISNTDISPNAYTKIAEFFFDDFPWEVL